ncbi:MAG: hypothetical protein AB1641_25515 [Thermodesulfobacteriota bacterium]
MIKLKHLGPIIIILAVAGCSLSGGQISPAQEAAEDAVSSRTYFSEAGMVLEAVKKVLNDYGFMVVFTKPLGPRSWTVKVKKAPTSDIKDKLDEVVVEGRGERETQVHLKIERSFWQKLSSEPGWAKGFYTSVFERMP